MKVAPIPVNEKSRIETLRLLSILDTQPEERFDRFTRMAKRLFSVPIAQVTLVDSERQWFKSSDGVEASETSRDISFCAHAILDDDLMLVPDALKDDRFFDNPLVTGDPNIRFYAGYPLRVNSQNLGTLCVIDNKPRVFDEEERQLLKDLAEMAERELSALQLATTDLLTTLSNRRGFELLARHTLRICTRMGKPATLLFFDLDRFKWINDTYGHGEGDRALKAFAQGLLSIFRDSDVIGRLGGDEFVVLLTGAGSELGPIALSRLEEWITMHGGLVEAGYRIQFSVGQVQFNAVRHRTVDELLADADAAMYVNKTAIRREIQDR
jgi:diguanylate cyclase (GGDEF)-like protein